MITVGTVGKTHWNMFLIIFGLLNFGTVAFGEYENTKWGMSPDSVSKLYPGGKLVREINGVFHYNVVKPVAGYDYSVLRFRFAKNGLDGLIVSPQKEYTPSLQTGLPQVQKKSEVDQMFTDLSVKLRNKYGKETAVEKDSIIWEVSTELRVILRKMMLLPGECKASFRNGCGKTHVFYIKPRNVVDLAIEGQEGL